MVQDDKTKWTIYVFAAVLNQRERVRGELRCRKIVLEGSKGIEVRAIVKDRMDQSERIAIKNRPLHLSHSPIDAYTVTMVK
jgi:hypothetical protein